MVRVITDSTSSIPADVREELGIEVLSLIINRDGVSYIEAETDLDAFYEDIYEMAGNIPTSSQPSQKDVKDLLERLASEGEEVVGVFISSRMSGTFETFLHVAKEVAEEYPDFEYAVVDSMTNCLEMGYAALSAATAAKEGMSLEQCVAVAEESLHSSRFLFTPESLLFLEKGGRIGKAAALLGHIINIAPILSVVDGEACHLGKARSQKKAMAMIVKVLEEDMANNGLKNLVVHYIGSRKPAEIWAEEVINPLIGFKARVIPASPVIGVHVGPAVGIAYELNSRIKEKYSSTVPEIVLHVPEAAL